MEIGESTVRIGEHPAIGPVRIEIGQTMIRAPEKKATSYSDAILLRILSEAETTNKLLNAIYTHLTRPPWWVRLWRRIHVAFTR